MQTAVKGREGRFTIRSLENCSAVKREGEGIKGEERRRICMAA
jgi:hypothetical protein